MDSLLVIHFQYFSLKQRNRFSRSLIIVIVWKSVYFQPSLDWRLSIPQKIDIAYNALVQLVAKCFRIISLIGVIL